MSDAVSAHSLTGRTSPSPERTFRALLAAFGPQGWWPVTSRGAAGPAYHPGRRRPATEAEALEIAVGAILTQNTAWSNVDKAIRSIQAAGAMSGPRLLSMRRPALERLIRSSGFYREKALKLKTFLARLSEAGWSVRGWLGRRDLGLAREELLAVRGVGPETADSILLYAAARPVFVVDAYTLRIGGRLGWFGGGPRRGRSTRPPPGAPSYAEAQAWLSARLPRSVSRYQEFHALLVALAKRHCRPEPLCGACPLARACPCGGSPGER